MASSSLPSCWCFLILWEECPCGFCWAVDESVTHQPPQEAWLDVISASLPLLLSRNNSGVTTVATNGFTLKWFSDGVGNERRGREKRMDVDLKRRDLCFPNPVNHKISMDDQAAHGRRGGEKGPLSILMNAVKKSFPSRQFRQSLFFVGSKLDTQTSATPVRQQICTRNDPNDHRSGSSFGSPGYS